MSNHQDLTGRGAVHPFAFVQASDPALLSTNFVTANKAWIDTSAVPSALKVRNASNTGWDTILGFSQSQVSSGWQLIDQSVGVVAVLPPGVGPGLWTQLNYV